LRPLDIAGKGEGAVKNSGGLDGGATSHRDKYDSRGGRKISLVANETSGTGDSDPPAAADGAP